MTKTYEWTHDGREELKIELELNEGTIVSSRVQSIGCLAFLKKCGELKKVLHGPIANLPQFKGNDHSSIIIREMISRIQNTWNLPVEQDELCHCRKVTTVKVDRSIVYGAKTVKDVRQMTSANTGCGTCKEDVESLLNYRLNKQ